MKLPPLNAIKAFEATVRCGTFTAAGAELGVSSAAVSLQVSKAEAFLGKKLFLRGNNSLTLTDAGQMLYPQVARALSDLSDITEQFLEQDMRSRIVISTIQSLAERLVVPAVAKFRKANPNVSVSIQIDPDPYDFNHHKVDLRVSFQDYSGTNLSSKLICKDHVVPVCVPEMAAQLPSDLALIPDASLIHVDWGETYTSYPTWAAWFRNFGNPRFPDTRVGIRAAGTGVGLELAAQGVGVVLAPITLAAKALSSGKVVCVSNQRLKLPFGYYATTGSLELLTQAKHKSRYLKGIEQNLKDASAKDAKLLQHP